VTTNEPWGCNNVGYGERAKTYPKVSIKLSASQQQQKTMQQH